MFHPSFAPPFSGRADWLGRRFHEVADEGYGIVSSENKIPHPALVSATLSPQVPVSLRPASQEESKSLRRAKETRIGACLKRREFVRHLTGVSIIT